MPDEPRNGLPYIWVTWITGLLSGDKQCRYAAWLKAHYKHERRPDGEAARLAKWKADHADLLQRRAAELRAAGWTVHVEGVNKFTRKGKAALLAGGPDLVAVRDRVADATLRGIDLSGVSPEAIVREARVEDAKTGQVRDSDIWQVIVYMLFLPEVHEALADGRSLDGAVVYPGHVVPVSRDLADAGALARVGALIRDVAADTPPEASPSFGECEYCDVASCRWRETEDKSIVATEAF